MLPATAKWVFIWCAREHLESIRIELVDWFREDGEVERDQETPEEQLAGVRVLLATTTSKGRACLLLACSLVPAGMKANLDTDASMLDYLIVDAINA